jgi:hypothetical protein
VPEPGAIGTLFYLHQPNGDTAVVPATVHRWDSSGSTVTSVFRLTNSIDAANVGVSPDGRWLSWVTVIGPDTPTLRLVDLGSGEERTVLVGVEPFFTPRGRPTAAAWSSPSMSEPGPTPS